MRNVIWIVSLVCGAVWLGAGEIPEASPPECVECPSGYHCVHNPEGCEADNPPVQDENGSN